MILYDMSHSFTHINRQRYAIMRPQRQALPHWPRPALPTQRRRQEQLREHHFHFIERKRHSEAGAVAAAEPEPLVRAELSLQKSLRPKNLGIGIQIGPAVHEMTARREHHARRVLAPAGGERLFRQAHDEWDNRAEPHRLAD